MNIAAFGFNQTSFHILMEDVCSCRSQQFGHTKVMCKPQPGTRKKFSSLRNCPKGSFSRRSTIDSAGFNGWIDILAIGVEDIDTHLHQLTLVGMF